MHWVNGVKTSTLPLSDRSIQFGDGVFRTMRKQQGHILFWPDHYRKLAHDARVLGLECPTQTLLEEELAAIELTDAVIKIILTRGNSERGYAIPDFLPVTRIISSYPLPVEFSSWQTQGVKVRFANWRLSSQAALAGIKHLNRLDNVMARAEWRDPAIFESLMLDQEGNVIEGVMSNLFILKDKDLWTPELKTCGVAGVMRDKVIATSASFGIKVRFDSFKRQDIESADGLILTNSLFGLVPVRECEQQQWHDFSLCTQLTQHIFNPFV